MAGRGVLDCQPDRGDGDRGAWPLSRFSHRLVMGSGLLQPVVLVADPGRRPAFRASGGLLRTGGAVCLEDELPGAYPTVARAVLPDPSGPSDVAGDPEHRLLVGRSRGVHSGTIRIAIRAGGGVGGGPGSVDALALAVGGERFSRAAVGDTVCPLGCPGSPRPAGRRGRSWGSPGCWPAARSSR